MWRSFWSRSRPVTAHSLVRLLEYQGPITTLGISHIRRATLGAVAFSNTQPFVRELAWRIHVFAHNGHLPGIARPQDLAFDRYHPFGIQTPNTLFAPCRNACVVCGAARLLRHRSRGDWEWSLNSSLIFANWGRPTFSMRMVRSCLPMAIDAHNARAAVLRRLVCSACRNNAVWQTSPSIPRACRLCLAFRP